MQHTKEVTHKWSYFPISRQAAVQICKAEDLDFSFIKQQSDPCAKPQESLLLRTGAKISFSLSFNSYVVYGYAYDHSDTLPYSKYVSKSHQFLPGVDGLLRWKFGRY